MPLNYKKVITTVTHHHGPTKNELKKRNNTVRKVLNAKGIPGNMGNKEILSRVKVYNNVMKMKKLQNSHYFTYNNDIKNKITAKISNFITNGRVFNQRKRKALVELMLRFHKGHKQFKGYRVAYNRGGGHIWKILALKNEDVIRYIKYMADYFGIDGVYNRTLIGTYGNTSWTPHYITNLMYNYRRTSRGGVAKGRRGSPIREDPAAVRVLKKRTAFLKEMLKINPNSRSSIINKYPSLFRNMPNSIHITHTGIQYPASPKKVFEYMKKEFPLPLFPNAAVTTIQKRGTVLGKRKRSPTSIKTTSAKRTKTKR